MARDRYNTQDIIVQAAFGGLNRENMQGRFETREREGERPRSEKAGRLKQEDDHVRRAADSLLRKVDDEVRLPVQKR